jgi:hypothetical protein
MSPERTAGQTPDGSLGHRVPRTILLLEPDPARAGQIRLALTALAASSLRVEWVDTLPAALERLGRSEIEAVLLGGSLCDGDGFDVLDLVRSVRPGVLVVVMSRSGIEPAPEVPGIHGVLSTFCRGIEAEQLQPLPTQAVLAR